MSNPDLPPDIINLPNIHSTSRVTHMRHRLIRWLARGDLILMNAELLIPPGWWLAKHPDRSSSLAHLTLIGAPYLDRPPIPGTVVIDATGR